MREEIAIWPPGPSSTQANRPSDCDCEIEHYLMRAGARAALGKPGFAEFLPVENPPVRRRFLVRTTEASWSYTRTAGSGGASLSGSYTITSTIDLATLVETISYSGSALETSWGIDANGPYSYTTNYYMRSTDGRWMQVHPGGDFTIWGGGNPDHFLGGGDDSFQRVVPDAANTTQGGTSFQEPWVPLTGIGFPWTGAGIKTVLLSEEFTTSQLNTLCTTLLTAARARLADVPLSWGDEGWTVVASQGAIFFDTRPSAQNDLNAAQAALDAADPDLEYEYEALMRARNARALALELAEDAWEDNENSAKIRLRMESGAPSIASKTVNEEESSTTMEALDYAWRAQVLTPWRYAEQGILFKLDWREVTTDEAQVDPLLFTSRSETVIPEAFATTTGLRWFAMSSRRFLDAPGTTGQRIRPVGMPANVQSPWWVRTRQLCGIKLGFVGYQPPPESGDVAVYRRETLTSEKLSGSHWYEPGEAGGYYGSQAGDPSGWTYRENFTENNEGADFPFDSLSLTPSVIHWPTSFSRWGKIHSNSTREIGNASLILSEPWTAKEFETLIDKWVDEDYDSESPRPVVPTFSPAPEPGAAGVPFAFFIKTRRGMVYGRGRSRFQNLWRLPETENTIGDLGSRELEVTWIWKRIIRDYDTGQTSMQDQSQTVSYAAGEMEKNDPVMDWIELPSPTGNTLVWLTTPRAEHPRFWNEPPDVEAIFP